MLEYGGERKTDFAIANTRLQLDFHFQLGSLYNHLRYISKESEKWNCMLAMLQSGSAEGSIFGANEVPICRK